MTSFSGPNDDSDPWESDTAGRSDRPEADAPGEPDGPEFEYGCPRCGHRPPDLTELFSATYRPSMSTAGRKIALAALIGLVLLLLLLLVGVVAQLLATTPPAENP
jgi:hypothetical protein